MSLAPETDRAGAVAAAVRARYEGVVDRIMMGLPNANDEQVAQVLAALRA